MTDFEFNTLIEKKDATLLEVTKVLSRNLKDVEIPHATYRILLKEITELVFKYASDQEKTFHP